jgi:Cft2 family RNA processing exonuclease
LISYAGSSGNTLADDKANIYIYLDSSGSLVTDEYTAFPDMEDAPHIRLAVATTSAGEINSIIDCRGGQSFLIPYASGGVKKKIEVHIFDDTLTEAESGSVHSNLGSTGTVTLTLPASASEGVVFTFAVQAAQELRIDPGTAAIRDDSGQTADKYKYANAIGESISLIADANGDWVTIGKNGTWAEEA